MFTYFFPTRLQHFEDSDTFSTLWFIWAFPQCTNSDMDCRIFSMGVNFLPAHTHRGPQFLQTHPKAFSFWQSLHRIWLQKEKNRWVGTDPNIWTVTHPWGDQTWLCLPFGFQEECCPFVPPTLCFTHAGQAGCRTPSVCWLIHVLNTGPVSLKMGRRGMCERSSYSQCCAQHRSLQVCCAQDVIV